jgi:CAI-1 autoinducer synthase
VHFQTASLAKAFAGRAGLITCASLFKDYFAMESFPAIFSSGLFDHDLAWLDQAAGFLQQADLRRSRLHSNACQLRSRLNELGYDVSGGTEQIIALEPGFETMTLKLRNALQARGIFGSVFCKPATGLNRSLVRFSINSGLGEEDIERLITACADIRNEVELHSWRRHSRS